MLTGKQGHDGANMQIDTQVNFLTNDKADDGDKLEVDIVTTADRVGRIRRSCRMTGTPTSVTDDVFDGDDLTEAGRRDVFRESKSDYTDIDISSDTAEGVRDQKLVALLKASSRTGTPYIGCCFLRETDQAGYEDDLASMDVAP